MFHLHYRPPDRRDMTSFCLLLTLLYSLSMTLSEALSRRSSVQGVLPDKACPRFMWFLNILAYLIHPLLGCPHNQRFHSILTSSLLKDKLYKSAKKYQIYW